MKKKYYFCKIKILEKKFLFYDIYTNIFQENWSKENFLKFIDLTYIETFLFYNKNKIPIGIGIFSIACKEVEIIKFGIKNDFRKRGIGFFCLKHIINIYKIKKKENIFLEVSTKNTNAINLYLKLGFKKINIRERYYQNNLGEYEDAFVMKKIIMSS